MPPDAASFAARAGMASAAPRNTALPVYVQSHGAVVSKDGECMCLTHDGKTATVRMAEVSQLVLVGNVTVTTPCLHDLMRRDVPVSWHAASGWFLGHTVGLGHNDVFLRLAQYRAATDLEGSLAIARGLVAAKIRNSRTRLRRKGWVRLLADSAGARLSRLAEDAETSPDLETLRGIEGAAAAVYFSGLGKAIASPRHAEATVFRFEKRERCPPADPVNAMLSFAYALLLRVWAVALSAAGFDALLGFYHRPVHSRPALALDMMEPYRPLLADSAVVGAINNGEVSAADFETKKDEDAEPGIFLNATGRKALIAAFERRLDQEVTPVHLVYTLSYRRLIAVQCRVLARHLTGELNDFPHFTAR